MNVATKGLAATERKKYQDAWALEAYHKFSPGVMVLPLFKQMIRRTDGATLLDIGAGAGAASAELAKAGWSVAMLDHVAVKGRPSLPLIKATLWENWVKGRRWDVGYCCDVMEHIPPEKVDDVLARVLEACPKAFFSVCFTDDHFGANIGHTLHLTVKPFEWWLGKFREFGRVKQARDILGMGVFYVAA